MRGLVVGFSIRFASTDSKKVTRLQGVTTFQSLLQNEKQKLEIFPSYSDICGKGLTDGALKGLHCKGTLQDLAINVDSGGSVWQ
jgi:hypothetical protein